MAVSLDAGAAPFVAKIFDSQPPIRVVGNDAIDKVKKVDNL